MRRYTAIALVVAVLAPYSLITSGLKIPIPDDVFVSDLADGEFPARVEAGRSAAQGEFPGWTSKCLTGIPLQVDPLSIALFAAFPPALALGLLIGILVALGALGAYLLSRRIGASHSGAFLAGMTFAWSGFYVCQLRHLAIIGVVSLFPWALCCIEQAFSKTGDTAAQARQLPPSRRIRWMALFALVLGMQLLCGFPQSVYISCLVYGALVVSRLIWLIDFSDPEPWHEKIRPAGLIAAAFPIAVLIAVLLGSASLLPLWDLGQTSDRSAGITYEFATRWKYDPINLLSFFIPYVNGDISDLTYGLGNYNIFWENYGYAGLCTLLAAMGASFTAYYAIAKFEIMFWSITLLIAIGIILGDATPLFGLAFNYLPGFSSFRFPTRFMFVVDLAIPLLAGLGVTMLQSFLSKRSKLNSRFSTPVAVGILIAAVTWMDVVGNNHRQNPSVDSDVWLKAPRTAAIIQQKKDLGRVYSPSAQLFHMSTFNAAGGWSGDLRPYVLHRELLQPNSNLLHNLSTLNAYSGITPRWAVDLVGDHNRQGILDGLKEYATIDAYLNWLSALSVRWVIFHRPIRSDRLQVVDRTQVATLHRLKDTLPRARFARGVQFIPDMTTLKERSISGAFDPRLEVAVHNRKDFDSIPAIESTNNPDDQRATITIAKETEVVVETRAGKAGLLLLADTWYPGWKATVDGAPKIILRVNVMHRGVVVSAGNHTVRFTYEPAWPKKSGVLTLIGLILLLGTLWLARPWAAEKMQK